jgi:ribonuclease HI
LVWDRGATLLNFDTPFKVETESFEKGEDISPPKALLCYTDGSKQKNKDDNVGVGAGFYITKTDKDGVGASLTRKSFHLEEYNSVYQAELSAIHQTAVHLLKYSQETLSKTTTYIMSDSKSVLQGLQKHLVSSKLMNQCLESLNNLASYTTVKLRWIKAHAGHHGNELADSLAKTGAIVKYTATPDEGVIDLEDIPAPYSHLTKLTEQGVNRLWSERFNNSRKKDGTPMYRQTKYFFKEPNKEKSYFLLRQNRETLGKVIQFITGHTYMNRHQNLVEEANIDQEDEEDEPRFPKCRLCDDGDETPFHLITNCTKLRDESNFFFGAQNQTELTSPSFTIRWIARKLLSFLELSDITRLMSPEESQADEVSFRERSQLDSTHTTISTQGG